MQPKIIARSEHPISRKNIDSDALKVLYRLYRSGHTAFLVGGGVRDLLIGRHPKDFDVSTSARPGQVKKLFRNCWLIGRRFRLAHIHFKDHKIIEVATFRAEPQRGDGESDEDLLVRQDNTFGTPEEDALRRDFTINGLFYDIASFSLIDYVGGVDDLESGVIRTIGDPHIRFQEDPVRMIRAVKFAARLDFAIEPETWESIHAHSEEIRKCSSARVLEEVARLMEGGASCRSIQLMKASGLLRMVLPELYEYLQGVPAGPSLRADSSPEPPLVAATAEEDLLFHADDDIDHEAQERMLGVLPAETEEDEEPVDYDDESEPLEEYPEEAAFEEIEVVEEVGFLEAEDSPMDEEYADADVVAAEATSIEVTQYADDEQPEVEEDEDEDIVLSDDDDDADEVLTPDGLRCPQAPDRGGLLWRTLNAVDQVIRSGRRLTRPTLFAALSSPILRHTSEWRADRDGGDADAYVPGLLRPLTSSVVITRRDRERVCQILAAQRRFDRERRAAVGALARKPYFPEALDLYEISVLASGKGIDSLRWWRERFPPVEPTMTAARVVRMPGDLEPREGDRTGRRRRRGRRGGRPVEEGRVEPPRGGRYESDRGAEHGGRGRSSDGSRRGEGRGASRRGESRGDSRRPEGRDSSRGGGRSEPRRDSGRDPRGEGRRDSRGADTRREPRGESSRREGRGREEILDGVRVLDSSATTQRRRRPRRRRPPMPR